tara:strand:- start:6206 stop:6613 length:408 start_codon:yes stop_codon:yes gene_type:complete
MTSVYRHFDESGDLLYVGRSINPFKRLQEHKYQSSWFDSVVNMTVEKFPTFGAAKKAEANAILSERPKFNMQHQVENKRPTIYGPKQLTGGARRRWNVDKNMRDAIAAYEAYEGLLLKGYQIPNDDDVIKANKGD